jgi:hypothetical protein
MLSVLERFYMILGDVYTIGLAPTTKFVDLWDVFLAKYLNRTPVR